MIQISHLRALSTFDVQSQLQRQIIIHDMTETLKWLNESVKGFENILYELRDEDIFLNVDDPSTEPWIWTNANQLVFETQDIDAVSIRYVRNFLLPYDKLLRATGVLPVVHPQNSISNVDRSESAILQSIRTGFNDLRNKGRWTDVEFVAKRAELADTIIPPLVAHRSLLAVFSDYFSDSFCGGFMEAKDASSSNPISFPVRRTEELYYSARCVQLLLGIFFYLYLSIFKSSYTFLRSYLHWQ